MFRNTIVGAALFACQISAAGAQQEQQPDSYIADIWQVYVTRCGLALEDPQGFLNSLPPTNTRGGPNSVLTRDEILLVSSTSHDGFTVDVDIITQSDGLNLSCHVFPSTSRFSDLEQYSAVEIEDALAQFLVAQGLQRPSGGELKNAYTGPQDGDELEYHYAMEVVLSGKSLLTRFEMTEGDLAVYFAGVVVKVNN
ncbi:MAG: hypothetical protein ABJN22_03380 [Litorimonas sp.]